MVNTSRLSRKQRGIFAEKFMEWGNLVFTGLVIAQIVLATGSFRIWIAVAGVFVMAVAYAVAYHILRGGEK